MSPNCWRSEQTLTTCLDEGLGDPNFDCSGLIIRAMCDVTGMDIDTWPPQLRHTRQLWHMAQELGVARTAAEAQPGDILVSDRFWTMPDGTTQRVPAHISIKASGPNTLQAQATDGAVVYRPPRLKPKTGARIGSLTIYGLEGMVAYAQHTGTLDDRVLKALS